MKRKKKEKLIERLLIEDYAAEGKSLGRVEGKVIFVENTVPGDVVDVRLTKNKADWALGIAQQFHAYSADRVEPFCSHFGVCGGCQWQMLPYEKQLYYKERQVEETLKRIGKVSLPPLMPILGAEETRFYRNKLEYTFGTKEYTKEKPPLTPVRPGHPGGPPKEGDAFANKKGNIESTESSQVPPCGGFRGAGNNVAGFHAKGFFDKIVDINKCWLQPEPTNALRLSIKEFAIRQGWSFYDIRNHVGFLRTMQVRTTIKGEVMVNIVVAEKDLVKIEKLMDHIMTNFPGLTTLLYTINAKMNDSLYDLEPVIFHGKGFITEELGEFRFRVGPKSFFQTNTKQAERLYGVTRDFCELNGGETVYDLYCGTGSIGIFVSPGAKKIIGVELLPVAIEDAKENAALNNVNTAEFFAGDVAELCNDAFFDQQGRPDIIITDPPRAGMHEKLVKKILDMAPQKVVYVSCNPATQARDINILAEKYEVTKVQPVDMFPHTLHLENVAQLKLK